MRLQNVGSSIFKRIWIVIALTLIAVLVGALVAYIQSPVYKVEIIVVATPPKNPTTKLPDATIAGAYSVGGLLASIANACESVDVAVTVSERLAESGIEISSEELLEKVSAVPEASSTSIKIAITDGSPTRAAEIANAWGDVLVLKTLPLEANELYDPTFGTLLLGGTLAFTNRAIPPEKPTQPKPLLYVGLGAFLGIILGFALVIGIEYFDPHFRSTQETEETLGLPVLGIIPRERGARAAALLPDLEQDSLARNAYSELRSSLIFTRREREIGSIMLAAAIPFEAGPAIAANLAMSVADTGRRTLLVDTDTQQQGVSGLLGAESKPGLSDALEGGQSLYGKVIKGGRENLDLLPSGKASPRFADLISLPLFDEGLRELEDLYDQVFIYSPPLGLSMNGAVMASKSDLSVVIIDADRCTRKAALEALVGFEHLNIKPSGVVLANVKVRGRERARMTARARPAPEPGGRKKRAKAAEATPEAPVRKRVKPSPAAPVSAEAPKSGPPRPTPPPVTEAEARPAKPPSAPTPAETEVESKTGEELQRMKEIVTEDFRRLGEKGAPIPKNWLRALNSDRHEVRESAETAISAYYGSFLRRYSIGEDSVKRITESIIMMMRREGEFSRMSEEEAQRYLQQMLVDAGARFSTHDSHGEAEKGPHGVEAALEDRGRTARKRSRSTRGTTPVGGGGPEKAAEKPQGTPQPEGQDEIDWE